jgi:hypothetical protein
VTDEQRRLAANLFNRTWELIGRDDRSPEDDDRLVHIAHASRFHWGEIGTAANLARGEWLCSRMYVTLGRAEPAVHHAERCLAYVEGYPSEMEDWDLPYAHEALARARLLAGDEDAAREHVAAARELASAIDEADDRDLLLGDLENLGLS